MKTVKIIAINIATAFVLLALINWACGLYLKGNNPQLSRDNLPNYQDNFEHAKKVFKDYNSVQHQYEPFSGWKCLPYKGETTLISSEGKRVTPNDNSRATRSVHFFGGSTMWGEGSDDNHTIPALFQQQNTEYTVVNHGQLAYNSRQELDALITQYQKNINPEVVIFYDGVNDAAFLCPKEIKDLPAHRLVPMYREKLYSGKSAVVKDLFASVFYDNILKVVHKFSYQPSEENSPYDCLSNPKKAEQIADIVMKNWELANEIVTKRGGRFIAILQPAAFVGNPRTDHLKLDEELGNNFREVYRHLKSKIAEKQYPWVYDLTGKFDGNNYIYIDFCHVSPNGNEIIAKEISKIIRGEFATVVSNVHD